MTLREDLRTMDMSNEIRGLIASARENHRKAYEYEQAASDRAKSIYTREFNKLKDSAAAGNTISRKTLSQIKAGNDKGFQVNVDTIASNDTIWSAHVANNQFYTRKADLDNQMAQTLMMAVEMGMI